MSLPLTSLVSSLTTLGFDLAAEIVVAHTYQQHLSGYNPTTGQVPANDSLIVSAAGVSSANGIYTKTNDALYNGVTCSIVFIEGDAAWYFYSPLSVVLYSCASADFPLGPWTADSGSYLPLPTVLQQAVSATVNAIVGQYTQSEVDGQQVRQGDERLVVKASDMGMIIPVVDDVMTAGSVKRQIVGIRLDPTGTVYVFQTRKLMQ